MNRSISYAKHSISTKELTAVEQALHSGVLTRGSYTKAFEAAICEYTNASYCIAVSSGTAALYIAFSARKLTNREAFVSMFPITFIGAANAAALSQHNIFYIDDPTKPVGVATMPMHYAGDPFYVRYPRINTIIDAAHSFGAVYKYKKEEMRVGNDQLCALCHCFSFHGSKTITTAGEGGAIVTSDKHFADRCRALRDQGYTSYAMNHREVYKPSLNFHLTEAQAAFGLEQLKRIHTFIKKRLRIANWYDEAFKNIEEIAPHQHSAGSVYHLYPIYIESRDQVLNYLHNKGIFAQVHYQPIYTYKNYTLDSKHYMKSVEYNRENAPKKNSFYTAYANQASIMHKTKGAPDADVLFPNAQYLYKHELSLPIYPDLKKEEVMYIIRTLKEAMCLK